MPTQTERANLLKSLHIKGDPLILFNIWDAGSARAIQAIGAKAIATGSWSVAAAHGYDDGEKLPLDLALANLKRIIAIVELPVTIDLEGGYGQSPAEVAENVTKVIAAGAVGINFEDQVVDGANLYSIEDQSARITAIRRAAEQASVPLFINARTDIFLKAEPAAIVTSTLMKQYAELLRMQNPGQVDFLLPASEIPNTFKNCVLIHRYL